MSGFVESHLGSTQVSRVLYGTIIGLALVVALEHQPPSPAVMVATLLGTAVAVALAEFYSEIVGTEVRTRRRIDRSRVGEIATDVGAVAFGISFPAVFFVLSVARGHGGRDRLRAREVVGLALTGFYGYAAARLAGAGTLVALGQATAVALIGAFLILLKALVH